MPYYYLIASLPMLTLGQVPALGEDAFRERCRSQLAPADAEAVEDVFISGGERVEHDFLAAWRPRETRLRNAVVRVRAQRLARAPDPFLRPEQGFDVHTLRAVAAAFHQPSPLDREFELDRFRWQVLDELAGPAPFTASAVLAYAFKLRLALRWSRLEAVRGRQVVESLVERQAAITLS